MTPVNPQILEALNAGIQSEVASYVFYIEAAKKSQAATFKELLQKLAMEEKQHFHVLERQHDSLIRSEKWISTADILKSPGLPEIGEEMSAQHRDLVSRVQQATTARAILELALQLEEAAFALFKLEAKRSVSSEGKKMYEELSKFEQGHMALIKGMMKEYPA
ncbi:MAG: hypothetical protein AB1644_01240 [Candidatus Zixiibacteriota bacterium]